MHRKYIQHQKLLSGWKRGRSEKHMKINLLCVNKKYPKI